MESEVYHIPALLPQALEALNIKSSGTYVDVTFGGGGHSRAIVERLGSEGHLYGMDQDADAAANVIDDARFTFVRSNFRYLHNFMRYYGVEKVDGILADLGVSFHHFDDRERGFSFRWDGPLDMRMNTASPRTAADILAAYTEEQLADMFYNLGEFRGARRLAKAIVNERRNAPIDSVNRFLEIASPMIDPRQQKKEAAMLFQALRIEVNDELGALRSLLEQSQKVLRPGGRLVVITYHSLEDRLVKNYMRTGNFAGKAEKDFFGRNLAPFRMVNSKPIVPDAAEIERNPRSRSAKMRVAEYLGNE